jgi:hypothetical protein
MLRVPENLQRAILDVLDERRATARELAKIIFGRPTEVGEELVRQALRTLESAGEVVPDKNSWLRWTEEKEKARQKAMREERAHRKKARLTRDELGEGRAKRASARHSLRQRDRSFCYATSS